jgi:hypothetical protein
MELVKVRTALATSHLEDLEGSALVYDKGRKRLVQQPLDAATKEAMGDDVRAFFEAEYRPAVGR